MKYLFPIAMIAGFAISGCSKVEETVNKGRIDESISRVEETVGKIVEPQNTEKPEEKVDLHQDGAKMNIEDVAVKDLEGQFWKIETGPLYDFTIRNSVWYTFKTDAKVELTYELKFVKSCYDRTPDSAGKAFLLNNTSSCVEFTSVKDDVLTYSGSWSGTSSRMTGDEASKYEATLKAYLDGQPKE